MANPSLQLNGTDDLEKFTSTIFKFLRLPEEGLGILSMRTGLLPKLWVLHCWQDLPADNPEITFCQEEYLPGNR